MFRPLRVTFHLDGSGVYYDPHEPLTLDGILAAACIRHHTHGDPPSRDEAPFDVPLPLQRWTINDAWGWHASALFPDGASAQTLLRWRKRMRQDRIELTEGSPNLTNGVYRDWDMPLPVLLCRRMVAYAYGDAYDVRRELRRNIQWLGKKRAHGRGRVTSIDVEAITENLSLVRDGVAQRWLPSVAGYRLVRTRPPYWNSLDRVTCVEIGEAYDAGASVAPSRRREPPRPASAPPDAVRCPHEG